jgi:hypothetical protein
MSVVGSRNFQFGLIAATLLAASMWSGAVSAYTPEQQQACTPDAMRLCGAYVPDVDRITACMIQNKSQLSPACRVYFRARAEPDDKPRKPKKPAEPEI